MTESITINSRERMLAAICHQPVDRVPTDIWAVPEVWRKLGEYFKTDDHVRIKRHLQIDGLASIDPRYVGPTLPKLPSGESVDYWGIRTKPIRYNTGVYNEQCFCPLAEAQTIDDLEAYAWPGVEWFDYSHIRQEALSARRTHAVKVGYHAPLTYHTYLRGIETALTDPLLEPDFTHHLLRRLCEWFYEHHKRIFEAADGLIDIVEVTDDYGSQNGPLISPAVFREFYKPHQARICHLAQQHGIKVFHHDDGAIREFIPDLIEIGVDILNPIQWRCPGMEVEGLKKDFGRQLCFHGGIDNQQTLPFGSPADVRAEVRHMIDTLANDSTGYIIAPCHNIQAITPVENILAMYDEASNYGQF